MLSSAACTATMDAKATTAKPKTGKGPEPLTPELCPSRALEVSPPDNATLQRCNIVKADSKTDLFRCSRHDCRTPESWVVSSTCPPLLVGEPNVRTVVAAFIYTCLILENKLFFYFAYINGMGLTRSID